MSEAIANLMNVPFRCRWASCLFIMRIRPPLQAHDSEAAAGVRVFRWLLNTFRRAAFPPYSLVSRFAKKPSGLFAFAIGLYSFVPRFAKGLSDFFSLAIFHSLTNGSLSRPFIMPSSSASILGKCFALYFTGLPAM